MKAYPKLVAMGKGYEVKIPMLHLNGGLVSC
jgi:hypothetical protein